MLCLQGQRPTFGAVRPDGLHTGEMRSTSFHRSLSPLLLLSTAVRWALLQAYHPQCVGRKTLQPGVQWHCGTLCYTPEAPQAQLRCLLSMLLTPRVTVCLATAAPNLHCLECRAALLLRVPAPEHAPLPNMPDGLLCSALPCGRCRRQRRDPLQRL